MAWTISFHETAKAEAAALSLDFRARLERLTGLIRDHGLSVAFELVRF